MATTRQAAGRVASAAMNKFPAEAGHTYDEVKEADMAALRHEMAEAAALHQWELIDGIDFPYDKCA